MVQPDITYTQCWFFLANTGGKARLPHPALALACRSQHRGPVQPGPPSDLAHIQGNRYYNPAWPCLYPIQALTLNSRSSSLVEESLKLPYRAYSQPQVLCMPVGAVAHSGMASSIWTFTGECCSLALLCLSPIPAHSAGCAAWVLSR